MPALCWWQPQGRGRWARVCYRTSLRTQQRDANGAAPGHSLPWGHTRRTRMPWPVFGTQRRGHGEHNTTQSCRWPSTTGEHPPGITSCLAPDPTTPTTASQSLQGPSGPSAVTEMQIKGCGFKNVINKDLQCPEEHLQAGRRAPSKSSQICHHLAAQAAFQTSSIRGSRRCSDCPQRGWGFLELLPQHFGVVISGASAPCLVQHEPEETCPSPRGNVRQEQLEQSPCDPSVHPGQR